MSFSLNSKDAWPTVLHLLHLYIKTWGNGIALPTALFYIMIIVAVIIVYY